MTLTSINEAFMRHRAVCKVCASDGPAVCKKGLPLLLHFHRLILNEVDREVAHEKAKAEVAEIQEARPGLRVLSRETLDRGLTRSKLYRDPVPVQRRQ